jgi:hypothetical protein
MAKVAPNPHVEAELMAARAAELEGRLAELDAEIASGRRALEVGAAGMAPGAPEVRALGDQEQRVLDLRMEQTRLRDELARMRSTAGAPLTPADPHAHLRHRRTPLTSISGRRNRIMSWWSVLSTPVLLYAIGQIILPSVGVSATSTFVFWVVLLLSIEGLVRGKFLAVMLRLLMAALLIVGLYYLVLDWRIVLGWTFVGAALLLLVVNLRDALKR